MFLSNLFPGLYVFKNIAFLTMFSLLKADTQILTALGEDMADDGYQDIVNNDISSVVIETMHAKYADKLALKCMLSNLW